MAAATSKLPPGFVSLNKEFQIFRTNAIQRRRFRQDQVEHMLVACKVVHPVSKLGLVGFDFNFSTLSQVLLGVLGNWDNCRQDGGIVSQVKVNPTFPIRWASLYLPDMVAL